MTDLSIAATPGEPLAPWFSAPRTLAGVRVQRFECASRGDRVSGMLWRPSADGKAPLVLAVHSLSRSANDPQVAAAARAWASGGWATAAIDLPLHGERHNAKLSRRAVAAAEAPAGSPADRELWRALVAQAVRDLARALDALIASGAIDPARIASVAFGDSAAITRAHASLDTRIRAAAALGSERTAAIEIAPAKPLSWFARPDDLLDFLAAELRS